MKYDRTCSARYMFVSNNVMSFNDIWRKRLYNFKQRVTKVTILLLSTYTNLPVTSTFWKNFVHVLSRPKCFIQIGVLVILKLRDCFRLSKYIIKMLGDHQYFYFKPL